MCPHRTTPARVFSGFSAALLRDRGISWCAVSVLTYLLTLPTAARVSVRLLASRRVEKPGRIVAALRELEELRYLRRVVREGERDGQRSGACEVFEVFERPYQIEFPTGETEKVGDRHAPSRHTVRAAHLLISLGRIDPRLTLDAVEAMRLAPLVEGWWERGLDSAQVRAALAYDWPGPVHSASAHVEARLRYGCPVASTVLPVTAVEVEFRRPGVSVWREAVRRGRGLARMLLTGSAAPA
jgi:hypothetical protein